MRVDGVDDPLGVRAAEQRPEVDVADHRDPVAVRPAGSLARGRIAEQDASRLRTFCERLGRLRAIAPLHSLEALTERTARELDTTSRC